MTTAIDIIKAAHRLIADRRRWTQLARARDIKGNPCPASSREAVCWCAGGAMARATTDLNASQIDYDAAVDLVYAAADRRGLIGITSANDNGGHEVVLRLFDEAAKVVVEKAE